MNKQEKKQHLTQLEEINKVGYKEYLTQGKCVKIKSGILGVPCTLMTNSSFLSLDKDFNLKLTPVILGVIELVNDSSRIACWNSKNGKLMAYIPNDLSSGIITRGELDWSINSFIDIDNPTIVEVLNTDSSIAYRYSFNQDSLNIMGYWLGNIYSSENYNRLNEFSALKLGVN